MTSRAALVALLASALLAGCLAEGRFPCSSNAKCQKGATAGRCVQGYCAYDDRTCNSSLRWDNTAPPGMTSQCVPPVGRDMGRSSDLGSGPVGDLSMPDLSRPDLSLSTPGFCTFSFDTFNDGCRLK